MRIYEPSKWRRDTYFCGAGKEMYSPGTSLMCSHYAGCFLLGYITIKENFHMLLYDFSVLKWCTLSLHSSISSVHVDQVTSEILTTICNHSFHCFCISKWTDPSCPVSLFCHVEACNCCYSLQDLVNTSSNESQC